VGAVKLEVLSMPAAGLALVFWPFYHLRLHQGCQIRDPARFSSSEGTREEVEATRTGLAEGLAFLRSSIYTL
jgi:hypothetical protein